MRRSWLCLSRAGNREDSKVTKEYCEVDYVPEESTGNLYREPLRFVAPFSTSMPAVLAAFESSHTDYGSGMRNDRLNPRVPYQNVC